MSGETGTGRVPLDLSPSDAKYAVIAFGATMLVSVCYVAVGLFFTVLPRTFSPTPLIVSLAVLIPTGVGYGCARLVGSARAARWIAAFVLVVGSVVDRLTAVSFRV